MSDLQWVPRNPRLCFAMSAAMSLRTPTKVYGRGKNSGNPVCRFCHIYLGLKTNSIPVFAVTQRQEFKGVKLSELLSEFGIRLNSPTQNRNVLVRIFNSCKFLSHLKLNMDDSQPEFAEFNGEETRKNLSQRIFTGAPQRST